MLQPKLSYLGPHEQLPITELLVTEGDVTWYLNDAFEALIKFNFPLRKGGEPLAQTMESPFSESGSATLRMVGYEVQ